MRVTIKWSSALRQIALLVPALFLLAGCAHSANCCENPFTRALSAPMKAASFKMDGQNVWGASIIEHEGRYYMFASFWPAETGTWVTDSQIMLAVADRPEGPFEAVDVVLPRRDPKFWDGRMTHNPTIRQHNGKFYLFYVGTTFPGEYPQQKVLSSRDPLYQEAWNGKRIGVAIADHPMGPWQRFDRPIIEPRPGHWDGAITSNPAPIFHEDGSITLIYKSIALPYPQRLEGERESRPFLTIGAARAQSVLGEYKRLGDRDGLIHVDGGMHQLEDMFAWQAGGRFHMILKNFKPELTGEKGSGLYLWSDDATNWYRALGNSIAYSRSFQWANGEAANQRNLERPQILFQNGKATHLYLATVDNEDVNHSRGGTYNIVFPIQDLEKSTAAALRND
jgi:hypothetical protein